MRYIANTGGLGVRTRPGCRDDSDVPGWPEGTRVVIEYGHADCPGWFWVRSATPSYSWVRSIHLSETPPQIAASATPTTVPTPTPVPPARPPPTPTTAVAKAPPLVVIAPTAIPVTATPTRPPATPPAKRPIVAPVPEPPLSSPPGGPVVQKDARCDYFIVDAPSGRILLQWYGGSEPDLGDVVVGGLETYGFVDAYNVTQRATLRVWVDDYFLSRDRAAAKYLEKCAWYLR